MFRVIRRFISLGLFGLYAAVSLAQPQAATVGSDGAAKVSLTYDIVSIRLADPDPSFQGIQPTPDQIQVILPPRELVARAYNARSEFVLGGPKWSDSVLFELRAKVDESAIPFFQPLSLEDRASMLKPVLASRFGLKIHTEARVLSVYDLVLAKGVLGPQFRPHSPDKPSNSMSQAGENFEGYGVGMPFFVSILFKVLSGYVGRPIVDKTGLTGTYDFILQWGSAIPTSAGAEMPATATSSRPDIFTAMQEQLGLKLQPVREPVEIIIIDSATMPSDN